MTPSTDLICFPGGDGGFPARVPPASDESGEEEQQDEGKGEEREEDGTSVEVQIGRKLREIADDFQQEHMQLVSLTTTWKRFRRFPTPRPLFPPSQSNPF